MTTLEFFKNGYKEYFKDIDTPDILIYVFDDSSGQWEEDEELTFMGDVKEYEEKLNYSGGLVWREDIDIDPEKLANVIQIGHTKFAPVLVMELYRDGVCNYFKHPNDKTKDYYLFSNF